MAQNTSIPLSLEDLIPGGKSYAKYRVSFPQQLQWWGDTPIYIKGDSIMSAAKSEKESNSFLIDKKAINSGLEANGKNTIKSLASISFPYAKEKVILVNNGQEAFLYNIESNQVTNTYNLPKDAANQDFSEPSKAFAYTKGNNLYVTQLGNEIAITSDSDKGIVNGQAVHRNEFGIKKGTFWSPSGNKLAFYRMDETMVADYPLVDISTRIAELKDIKYPMAGLKSHHVTVGIFNL